MLDDTTKESLTFDDVLLVPAASNVLPRDVNTSTLLTKNILIIYLLGEMMINSFFRENETLVENATITLNCIPSIDVINLMEFIKQTA